MISLVKALVMSMQWVKWKALAELCLDEVSQKSQREKKCVLTEALKLSLDWSKIHSGTLEAEYWAG